MFHLLLLLLSCFVESKKEKKPCACQFYTQENISQITQQENVTVVAFRVNLNQTNYKPCSIKKVLKQTRKLLKIWKPENNRSIQIAPFLVEDAKEAIEKPELALLDFNGTIVAKEPFDIIVKEQNITAESEVNATQNANEENKEEKVNEAANGEEEAKEGEEEAQKEESEEKKDKKHKKEKKDKKGKKEKKDKKGKKDKKNKQKVKVETNFQEVLQNLLEKENIDIDFVKLAELKKAQKSKKEKKPKNQAEKESQPEPEAENTTKEL